MKIGVCGLEVPRGKIKYSDERLLKISEKFPEKKVSPYFFEFTDNFENVSVIAASKEGLLELIIQDMEKLEKVRENSEPQQKKILEKCLQLLESEKILCDESFSEEEKKYLTNISPLTLKPVVLIDEIDTPKDAIKKTIAKANLGFFYTTAKKEIKAWLFKRGESIVECASKIHTDLARGFIRAEVVNFKDFVNCHNLHEAKEKGFLKTVSKDYKVQDGDIIEILFHI